MFLQILLNNPSLCVPECRWLILLVWLRGFCPKPRTKSEDAPPLGQPKRSSHPVPSLFPFINFWGVIPHRNLGLWVWKPNCQARIYSTPWVQFEWALGLSSQQTYFLLTRPKGGTWGFCGALESTLLSLGHFDTRYLFCKLYDVK